MSHPVATLAFGGIRRAYTLDELLELQAPPGAPLKERKHRLDGLVARTVLSATEAALRAAGGDVKAAAVALGVSIRTLYYNCERHGLRPADYRSPPDA